MLEIYFLLIFCFLFQRSDALCPQQPNGVFRFGPKCGFMCHCRNNEQCDENTGECTSGCASFWYGPGCQYRDIAEGEFSNHSDNLPYGQEKYSILANDGYTNTCSYTAEIESSAKNGSPFWRVWFPTNETIRELKIVTLPEKLHYFRRFTVFVEYLYPSEKEKLHYAPLYRRECYKHGDDVPHNESFTVSCSNPVVGNQVKLELAELNTQLVLCDVKINGGRNLAFGRKTSQISKHKDCTKDDTCSSDKAVDGNESNEYWKQCTFTAHENDPWWETDLDHKTTIWYIRILLRKVKTSVYQLEVSNATKEVGKSIYDVNATTSLQINLTLNTIAEIVKLTRMEKNGRLEICEVYIFGDCLEDICGYGCGVECHCIRATVLDKMSGSCSYGCKDGWMGSGCDIQCDDGTFGSGCNQNCSGHCKNDKPCDTVDGSCLNGCSKGYEGNSCNQKCPAGFYGNNCTGTCSKNCVDGKCRHKNGKCTKGCTAGWKGKQCNEQCNNGTYGYNCSMNCSRNCKNNEPCKKDNGSCPNGCKLGFGGVLCSYPCASGEYGENCNDKCSQNCVGVTCNHIDGRCTDGCVAGWTGQKCEEPCKYGLYGKNCSRQCSDYCKSGKHGCSHVNGSCHHGCKAGWKGNTCEQECEDGTFGNNCQTNCSGNCKNDALCEKVHGSCPNGCKPGYFEKMCARECMPSFYGINCSSKCSEHCHGGSAACSKVNGSCLSGCHDGWNGHRCDRNCTVGFYGEECRHNCSSHCEGGSEMCNSIDGHCLSDCKAGWKGAKCDTECSDGFYGINCFTTCGNCKSGTVCHKVVGTCSAGCESGYSGHNCLQGMQKSDNMVAMTTGGVVALVIFILTIVTIIVVIYRKRKEQRQRQDKNETNLQLTSAVFPRNCDDVHLNDEATGYAEGNSFSTSEVNVYNNDPSVSKTKHAVPLSSLLAYVKRNLASSDYFTKEFQELPFGMKYPSTVGANPFNRKKNRYKDMQAYNHTRVMLKALPKEQGSDYINASFIRGHAKEKAYIAAQGPIETTIDDFWRMIWEKNVYTIAMVTNLVEETKTKCLQYWPTVESSTRYGDFIVRTESEAIFAEFTIRNLKVVFEEEKPSRTISQFHFTAWPDHSVPRSTSSLLQFWRKVRNNDANKAHTWLVHCSAGVGRTGTFIATDILYDQGKDKGYVDVYQCVRNLRDQRVNMVQTKDQYLFLHGLMIEAFILPSEPVPLEHFHQVVNDLKDVDKAARKTKLLLQYETLKEDMTYMFTKDETEEKYSAAMLEENRNKNRNNSILPPNEFRPFLITAIDGCTNYINAVYIPSYCNIHGYIITQTPLENTVIDCCRLVYEQEVKVIVTFPAKVKEQDNTYLPEDSTVNLGPFTVAKVSEEDKHFYKKKTFVMAYNSEERELTQLMFNYWPVNRLTPSDPLNMLNFMQEVEFHRRIADNKPVLVQCLDGSEKSGLFVVLMNILERARLDNEVSIPQVIRQLRIRRQQIIPNFEQFKFCYDVLLCHVDSNAMYANM